MHKAQGEINGKMEHELINQLINLMCKGGCESFVGNFQHDATAIAPRKTWTESDIKEAVDYVRYMNEYFGKQEAIAVITSLVSKFHISQEELTIPRSPEEKVGLES